MNHGHQVLMLLFVHITLEISKCTVSQIDFEIFRTIDSFNKISSGHSLIIKVEFAVVPTDTICGQNLSKIPVDMNSIFMKLYVI